MRVIQQAKSLPAPFRQVEIVERKGLGHPDTLIDHIMEGISRRLCDEYLNKFGKIAHHNVDKGLIVGGESSPEYGGGEVLSPVHVFLTGRATHEYDGIEIPVDELAIEVAQEELSKIRNFDARIHATYESKIRPGSKDLVEIFMRSDKHLANDTSFGVGFAPFSKVEKVALHIEAVLNSDDFKAKYPFVGEDIKVMATREGSKARITVAVAFVSKFVSDGDDYFAKKDALKAEVEKLASEFFDEPEIFINTGDSKEAPYLTVTGTSIEAGDDGSVGRGNRINGLITPMRPMTLEAAAGKNPVTHTGKIYSALAFRMAKQIEEEIAEVQNVDVFLLSQIGRPINDPKIVNAELYGVDPESVKAKVEYIIGYNLDNIGQITEDFVKGKLDVA